MSLYLSEPQFIQALSRIDSQHLSSFIQVMMSAPHPRQEEVLDGGGGEVKLSLK
jgi:hypothetical protein